MLQMWRRAKVMTWAGYILGFPTDTPESIARDIETIKRELPIDILEFFFLTPLPGSEDHKVLHLKGARMEQDMNNYDLEHVCADHAIMSADTWRGVYRDAWARYYSDAHVETVLRRAVASGINPRKIVDAMTVFSGSSRIEGVHPLQFGYVRRKVRTQRRHGPIVNPLVFYPWRAWDFCRSRENGRRWRCATARSCAGCSPTERRGLRGRSAEALGGGRPRPRFRRRLPRRQGQAPVPDPVSDLDPDNLVPGPPRSPSPRRPGPPSRYAAPNSSPARWPARGPHPMSHARLPEHPGHEGAGRPDLPGHRRDRHALAELCRGHQGHRSSLARSRPRTGTVNNGGRRTDATAHSARRVKPDHGHRRPPSAGTPAAPQTAPRGRNPIRTIPIGLDQFCDWSRPQGFRVQHGFSTRSGNDGK